MASSIGGGNFIPRLDQGTLENLRQHAGTAASQSKEVDKKPKESGVTLSKAAQKSLQGEHQEHIQGHEHELAQQAGVEHEARPEERQQPPPDMNSADKVQARLQAAKLAAYDDPETVFRKLMEDIPEANMEAAERVLEGQMKQGLKKVSQLKSGPEAENAGKMELEGADYLVEPLDIRGSDNDQAQPLTLDI